MLPAGVAQPGVGLIGSLGSAGAVLGDVEPDSLSLKLSYLCIRDSSFSTQEVNNTSADTGAAVDNVGEGGGEGRAQSLNITPVRSEGGDGGVGTAGSGSFTVVTTDRSVISCSG